MAPASEPTSGQLYEIMRGSSPEAATRAFEKFLLTRDEWWSGDIPLTWARRVARQHLAKLERMKWPVHKIDDPDGIANDALMRLLYLAPRFDCPPAFLRRCICNSIEWEIAGRGRKGEPWATETDEALTWIATPSSDGASARLWRNKRFCREVAVAINSLSDTLRPYAIRNLLDGQRAVEIARTLKVDEAKARQYLRRALQVIVGRKDVKRLLKLDNSRVIRRALEESPVEVTMNSSHQPPATDLDVASDLERELPEASPTAEQDPADLVRRPLKGD